MDNHDHEHHGLAEKIGGEDIGQTSSIRQVALASFMGTTIEWYDFFIYGTASALVFNQLFFPEFDPVVGTIAALGTFTVGFVARPIGGAVFGHFGDRIGRKTLLILTLLIMGTATFIIGLLPTYQSIGIWAPILLVFFRICQGIGVGGEWGGAVLMAVEHAPSGRRGFFGAWPQMGVPAALLLANGVFLAFTATLPEEQFLSWGWRIPFLLSIVIAGVGLFIRLRIRETPAFAQVKEQGAELRMPVLEVIRRHPKNLLLIIGARFAEAGPFYIFTVFALTYVSETLGLSRSVAVTGVLIAAAIHVFALPAFGALSDRVGRRPVYIGGAVFTGLFAFPFFWLLDTRIPVLIWLALVVALVIGHAAVYGPQAAFFAELFSTRVRYSALGLGYQLAVIFAGGFAPLIATALLAWSGGESWSVAAYLVVMALITIVSVYFAAETFQEDIAQEERAEARQYTTSES